jgi:hypothetical protein
MLYFEENKKQIKRLRSKSKQRDEEMCKSDPSNVNFELKTPIPNANHMHCGVCKTNFEDYKVHLRDKQHLTNLQLQKAIYDYIDEEIRICNK